MDSRRGGLVPRSAFQPHEAIRGNALLSIWRFPQSFLVSVNWASSVTRSTPSLSSNSNEAATKSFTTNILAASPPLPDSRFINKLEKYPDSTHNVRTGSSLSNVDSGNEFRGLGKMGRILNAPRQPRVSRGKQISHAVSYVSPPTLFRERSASRFKDVRRVSALNVQIRSHGLSHILREREDEISVGFRAADLQAPTPPIDVCKCDVGDLLGTEPETQEDQQKRPVTKVAGLPTFTG